MGKGGRVMSITACTMDILTVFNNILIDSTVCKNV